MWLYQKQPDTKNFIREAQVEMIKKLAESATFEDFLADSECSECFEGTYRKVSFKSSQYPRFIGYKKTFEVPLRS